MDVGNMWFRLLLFPLCDVLLQIGILKATGVCDVYLWLALQTTSKFQVYVLTKSPRSLSYRLS